MPIYNLSLEKIEEFEEKLKKMQEELDMINSKSENDLWREDIDEIKRELVNYGYKVDKPKKLKIKVNKN